MKTRLALSAALLLAAPALDAAILKVPGDHLTIAGAAAACANGDTILVSKGTYEPFVLVGKADVTILGKGKVVIEAAGHLHGVEVVNSPGAVLRRLRVVHADSTGIVALNSAGVRIERCRVSEGLASGIGVGNCDDAVIRDNRVRDVQWSGVTVSSGDGVFVRGNDVRGGFQGFSVLGSKCVVLENTIRDVQADAIAVSGSSVSVLDNRARGGFVGVWVESSSSSVTVAGNRVTKPKGEGIRIESVGVNVLDNRIKKSVLAGIRMSADDGLVAGNVVRGGSTVGLLVESAGGTYLENSARKSGQYDLDSAIGLHHNDWFENDFPTVAP